MSNEKLTYSNIFEAITEDKGEAAVLKFRAELMLVMRWLIEHKKLSHADIRAALGVSQERAAELTSYKVNRFLSDELIGYLAILGVQFSPRFTASCDELHASLLDSPPR